MLQILLVGLAGISLAVLFLFGFYSCKPSNAEPPRTQVAQAQPASKRQQLQERLETLSRSKPPSELSHGAKCYKRAMPPATADYLCPVCNSRTHHTLQAAVVIQQQLPSIQDLLKDLPGVKLTLDASEFCKKCKPDVEEPQLILKVQIPGEKEIHQVRGITVQDARLIKAFLEGKDKYPSSYGREFPLKEQLARVRELLGIQAR